MKIYKKNKFEMLFKLKSKKGLRIYIVINIYIDN